MGFDVQGIGVFKGTGAGTTADPIIPEVSGAGGAGGGPATIADGADIAQGSRADAAVTNPATAASVIALLKGLLTVLEGTLTANVAVANFPATQPVSAAALPLPAGAATQTTLAAIQALLALSKGAGVVDATTLRAVLASDGPTVSALGATTDAAVADAAGSLIAHTRAIAKAMLDGTQIVQGSGAQGAAVAGNPNRLGGRASGTAPTAVTTGQLQDIWIGLHGELVMGGVGPLGDGNSSPAGLYDPATSTIRPLAVTTCDWDGLALDRKRVVRNLKTAQSTATASGSDLTLWTPGAGKKFRLRNIYGRASNAGRYEARDATGTVIAYFYLTANAWSLVVSIDANGYLSAAANNALLIRNQSGGAADMDFVASGNEE